MQTTLNNTANSAIVGIYTLLLGVVITVCLSLGQAIFIPLALAILLSFSLSQFVSRLEKWLGRTASVLLIVVTVFCGISSATYVMTHQLIDLVVKLPDYKANIETKIHSLHIPESGVITRLFDTLKELKDELPGGPGPSAVGAPGTPDAPLQVVETKTGFATIAESFLGVFLTMLGTTGFVLLLVFFMLFNREDLRGRMIRLIGQGRISATTRAMDDASSRVSHYLFMQLIVNTIFGVAVATGLYLLGIPNAVLWGGIGIALRFIPFLGTWVAASIPVILSLAVSSSWALPLMTLSLFLGLELIICNAVEPWLYGSSTGVSPMALTIAAVFWTWLWGPIGLVLSTPLTVCLLVMGHHVAKLEFLKILLSDEEPLTPADECYHRLLAADQNEAVDLVETYLKAHPIVDLYDSMFIPVISHGEADLREGLIDTTQNAVLQQTIREIVEDQYNTIDLHRNIEAKEQKLEAEAILHSPKQPILCMPARADRDELAGSMLAQVLEQRVQACENVSAKLAPYELIAFAEKRMPEIVCISVVAPSTIIHARYLCTKLRLKLPQVHIIIGIWGASGILPDALTKLRAAGANEVVFSLAEATALLEKK